MISEYIICPVCGKKIDTPMSDELKKLIQECKLLSEDINPGGRELIFKIGGRIQVYDQCNNCDHIKIMEHLKKSINE